MIWRILSHDFKTYRRKASMWPRFVPYLILAFICGLASVGIAYMVMMVAGHVDHTSDVGLCAMAGMVAAPAVMGIGIAAFMSHDGR
jgi:hypothetical protein